MLVENAANIAWPAVHIEVEARVQQRPYNPQRTINSSDNSVIGKGPMSFNLPAAEETNSKSRSVPVPTIENGKRPMPQNVPITTADSLLPS